jgi:hypothetical protein
MMHYCNTGKAAKQTARRNLRAAVVFGKIVVTRWFRYGGGITPPPTQPPIIEMIPKINFLQK